MTFLHNVSNDCKYKASQELLVHAKKLTSSATKPRENEE